MRSVTVEKFKEEMLAQGMTTHVDVAFVCPLCGTVQSARDLIAAGAGNDFDSVEKYLAFSCVGRFTGAQQPRKVRDGRPCNWTLGGLFKLHTLEVLTPDGHRHPRFELATPEQAQAHAERFRPEPVVPAGYTAEELDRDNPHNAWMREVEP